ERAERGMESRLLSLARPAALRFGENPIRPTEPLDYHALARLAGGAPDSGGIPGRLDVGRSRRGRRPGCRGAGTRRCHGVAPDFVRSRRGTEGHDWRWLLQLPPA